MSVLALGALSASGCDDDETKDTSDAGDNGGDNNNNNNNNGDVDAGEKDAGGPKPLMCDNSDDACTDNNLGGITLKACCTEGADVCGLDTSVLAAVGVPFAGCYERAAPGVASEFCGGFFDMIDVKDGDKQFNLSIAQRMLDAATGFCAELTQEQKDAAINFAPCCTPKGECGVFIDNVEFMGSFNLDLGCVAASELMPAPAPEDPPPACMQNPATARRPTTLPYCSAESGAGECPEKLTAAICGPLGGAGIACTPGETTPDFVCTWFGLPKKGEAAPPTITTCMPGVAEYVQGCGPGVGNGRCIPNVPPTIYGCVNVTADIPGLPANACGCGENTPFSGTGPFCLSNVAVSICGTTALTTMAKPGNDGVSCVAMYPEFLQGCGAANGPTSYPPTCIPHVAREVVGCEAITENATCPPVTNPPPLNAVLCGLPSAGCGCGETGVNPNTPADQTDDCLSYLPTNVCGRTAGCTNPGSQGNCPEGQICADVKPSPQDPDGFGDVCIPAPPPP